MQDNADLQHKLLLRSHALGDRRPALVLDAYAGEGVMTRMLWRHVADQVVCIEKSAAKARKIEGARVIVGDNCKQLALAAEADVIDCDAYGLVMPFVSLLAQAARPGTLIVFTDGTPVKAKKVASARRVFHEEAERLLYDLRVEESASGMTYYGYGWLK